MEGLSLTPLFSKAKLRALGQGSKRGWTRRADLFLVLLALIGIGLHELTERTRLPKPRPHLTQKMAAATRTLRCYEAIRQHRLGAPATQDQENDPEATGLIGQEQTLTTTDRGVLEAKLTSVNPNFAAVFVDYFMRAGLKPGDPIAVSLTGSFPALNVALLCAAEELQLKPVVITSVGASMWGANDPAFTWLDMERLLNEKALLSTRSTAASLGGSNDRGRGLSPKGRSLLRAAVERNGVAMINEPTLEEAVKRRVVWYDSLAAPGKVRAFVNVGGGSASIGNQSGADMLRPGFSRTLPKYNFTQRGVLHVYAHRGTPFIHILNIESIARTYGLPQVPERMPPVGQGRIYYEEAYDLRVAAPALVIYLVLCFGILRARQKAAKAAREIADPVIPGVTQAAGERSGG
jgi:poly-gamma-glutamate system protein